MEKHRRAKLQAEKSKEIVHHKKPSKAPKTKPPEVEGVVWRISVWEKTQTKPAPKTLRFRAQKNIVEAPAPKNKPWAFAAQQRSKAFAMQNTFQNYLVTPKYRMPGQSVDQNHSGEQHTKN